MKYLIFSDSHLSDTFNLNKFRFLKKIIESSDRIIINGDFWEGYEFNFSDFIKSKWVPLFRLLKSKKTVYIYGNHDKVKYSNKNVSLFSSHQKKRLVLKSGRKTFYIEHGDRITPLWDKYFKRMPRFINRFFYYLEKITITLIGMNGIGLLYKRFNEDIKNKVAKKLKNNEYLVCGHSHFMEIDEKHHYINNGFVKHGLGQYVTIENGKITLHNEKY